MYKSLTITVIIPCLNEEQGIEKVLRAMPEFVDEVIVVDNNSTDRTSEVAAALGAKVIREEVRGYGRSYKRGFAEATSDLIVTLDGDHSYPVDALSYLIEAFLHLGVDFLNASRFPVRDRRGMSVINEVGNLGLSLAMSLLFFRWVRDSQSGMWVFRRSILKFMKLESDGMGFSEEIKIEALRDSRIRFGEISIMYSSRLGETKLNLWRDGMQNLLLLFKKRFPAMNISAIVPVWNKRDLLACLLTSLEAQTRPAFELLIVDNGSTDGAPEMARARGARVIAMGRNAGFAVAVNRGIREASQPLLAILNSDVELAPDYLEKLSAVDAPFATGKILSPSGLLDGTFDLTCRGATTWRCGAGHEDVSNFEEPRDITSPPWTAVLYRAEVFRQVGLLEESFESYLEDADFGLRCALLHITGRYVPAARAVHVGSAALGRWHPETVRRISRNQLLLAARHYSAHQLWPILVAQLLWGSVALRHGQGLAWARGKLQGLRHFSAARMQYLQRDPKVLEQVLHSNEQFIRAISRERYWRLYFQLTGGAK